MPPTIAVNYLAVLACVLVSIPVGFLWFGPLFGTSWARHVGMGSAQQSGGSTIAKAMVIYLAGCFLMAFVLTHSIQIWRPSTWNAGPDVAPWVYALNGALWTWVGFVIPIQIARVAWEAKAWSFVFIVAGFDLVRLLLYSFILAYWP